MNEMDATRFIFRHYVGENIFLKKAKNMRCPKCGYISFDYQETCKNCKKNIGDAVTEVNGTVCEACPPAFLQLETRKRSSAQPLSAQADSAPELAVREGIDTEFVLDDEEIAVADDGDELMMDLDEFSEAAPREEYTLSLDEDPRENESKLLSLDFGNLDISDLAPPDKEQFDLPLFEEELEEAVSPALVAALSDTSPPHLKLTTTKSMGLEDLHISGLNLNSPTKFVAGSVAGKRYAASVKTGTALDKFDIDLDELFEQNKK